MNEWQGQSSPDQLKVSNFPEVLALLLGSCYVVHLYIQFIDETCKNNNILNISVCGTSDKSVQYGVAL